MSEYRLNHGSTADAVLFAALDDFTQGYITAAYWTADEGLDELAFADLATESLEQADGACQTFQRDNAAALAAAYEHGAQAKAYTARGAGVDFWLTRNGHGSGFADREFKDALAGSLADAARAWGACDLYLGDDDRLHFTGESK